MAGRAAAAARALSPQTMEPGPRGAAGPPPALRRCGGRVGDPRGPRPRPQGLLAAQHEPVRGGPACATWHRRASRASAAPQRRPSPRPRTPRQVDARLRLSRALAAKVELVDIQRGCAALHGGRRRSASGPGRRSGRSVACACAGPWRARFRLEFVHFG